MPIRHLLNATDPGSHQSVISWPADEDRSATWLAPSTPYSSNDWLVSDSAGDVREVIELSLELRMPDGRPLSDWPEFHFVVKEFAFRLRDRRYTRIDDAELHVGLVCGLMTVCHGLAHRGFRSFKQVTKDEWERLLPAFKAGSDGLLCASDRVEKFLKARDCTLRVGYVKGLPLRDASNAVDSSVLLREVGLPDYCKRLPRVADTINREAKALGLRVKGEIASEPPVFVGSSATHLFRFFQAIELLWVIRRHLGEHGLPEKPFDTTALALSRKHGKEAKPTPTPSPAAALHLLSQALVWVSNYAPPLLGLLKSAQAQPGDVERHVEEMPQEGPRGSPWPLRNASRSTQSFVSANKAIKLLAVACFIVLASFSARRKDEILGFRSSDYEQDRNGRWWLYSYVQKTLLRRVWIPIPDTAALAMDVLCAISQSARELDQDESVFLWISPFRDSKEVSELFDVSLLDEFARHVGAPAAAVQQGEIGSVAATEWHWTPHQFRKFFAVLYYNLYRGATIEVLAQFLRHFNLEMTRRYLLLDMDVEKFFRSAEQRARKDIARGIAGKRIVHGGMTKALRKAAAAYRRELTTLHVVAPDFTSEGEAIERQMDFMRLVLRPMPWADCFCPDTHVAATQAMCRRQSDRKPSREDVGPNPASARASLCSECHFSTDNGRMRSLLDSEEADLQANMTFAEPGSVLDKMLKARLIDIRRVTVDMKSAEAELQGELE